MAKKLAFDKWLFTVIVALLGFGLIMVYSASAAVARDHGQGINPFLLKQGVAAVVGLLLMVALMHFDYRRFRPMVVVYGLLCLSLASLVAVLFSPELNGTSRWFFIGPFSLQPSEGAKIVLVLFLAYQLDRKIERVNQPQLLVPCGLVAGLCAFLVLLEPDLGNAVLMLTVTFVLVFLAGLAWRYLFAAGVVLAPLIWFLVISVPYRRQRLFAFLDPEKDPLGSGFQALQSLIAVGSGGVFGLGLGDSMQKQYFLPHPHSDFVYAIVAEELGLIGALGLVALFMVFLWRGVRAGLRAPDTFGRYLAWGLTATIVIQAMINASVAVALLPTKGIPLPLISYGGSSLVATLAACGLLLNISEHS
ncbi:MAG: putative lipid II flippase FtsW [Acidobacteriota bacterium]